MTLPVTDEWGDDAGELSGKTVSVVLSDNGLAQQMSLKVGALCAVRKGDRAEQADCADGAGGRIYSQSDAVRAAGPGYETLQYFAGGRA